MNNRHFAVIALGSNLENPAQQVRAALDTLSSHPDIRLKQASSLYMTAPVGYDNQPDFINAVCTVSTTLDGIA
ncbi:2-amino-4-hydroxy-6-hydroxymethyldihydropteridine diphosphokinase, partial [Klebsiella pneumoniae]|nr:2-amino-4-hydroxy-6-hydroxymethyldihydropteridine diphosphokinase [Klebsiella pneumoniae]